MSIGHPLHLLASGLSICSNDFLHYPMCQSYSPWSWAGAGNIVERVYRWLGLLMTAFNKRSHSGLNDGMSTPSQHAGRRSASGNCFWAYCKRVFSLCGGLTARKQNRTTKTRVFLKVNSSVLEDLWACWGVADTCCACCRYGKTEI